MLRRSGAADEERTVLQAWKLGEMQRNQRTTLTMSAGAVGPALSEQVFNCWKQVYFCNFHVLERNKDLAINSYFPQLLVTKYFRCVTEMSETQKLSILAKWGPFRADFRARVSQD